MSRTTIRLPLASPLFPYTTLFRSVTVYAAGASGNVAPIATIGGSSSTDNTGLNYPVGIARDGAGRLYVTNPGPNTVARSEEHTSELQSHSDLVCRLLLEKKKEDRN